MQLKQYEARLITVYCFMGAINSKYGMRLCYNLLIVYWHPYSFYSIRQTACSGNNNSIVSLPIIAASVTFCYHSF